MAFAFQDLAAIRPFLYHLTARANLERIRRGRELLCASELARLGGREGDLRKKRAQALVVQVGHESVHIRDQRPLHVLNMELEGGWDFGRFLSELNRRVFFWPGNEAGPIPPGLNHFERYREDDIAVIRVRTESMPPGAEVCFYNSGSPRWSGRKPSPRGPATFLLPGAAQRPPSQTVEVTWVGAVALPDWVQVAAHPTGPWRLLCSSQRRGVSGPTSPECTGRV